MVEITVEFEKQYFKQLKAGYIQKVEAAGMIKTSYAVGHYFLTELTSGITLFIIINTDQLQILKAEIVRKAKEMEVSKIVFLHPYDYYDL